MKIRDYKITEHNSTVNGDPGRYYNWAKFDWNQETEFDFKDARYSTESEFVPDALKGQLIGIQKAPKVYKDDYLIDLNCEYLHIPYNWSEDATIFRVRPNESMRAGRKYRGYLITKQKVIKKKDGWYWRLYLTALPEDS